MLLCNCSLTLRRTPPPPPPGFTSPEPGTQCPVHTLPHTSQQCRLSVIFQCFSFFGPGLEEVRVVMGQPNRGVSKRTLHFFVPHNIPYTISSLCRFGFSFGVVLQIFL